MKRKDTRKLSTTLHSSEKKKKYYTQIINNEARLKNIFLNAKKLIKKTKKKNKEYLNELKESMKNYNDLELNKISKHPKKWRKIKRMINFLFIIKKEINFKKIYGINLLNNQKYNENKKNGKINNWLIGDHLIKDNENIRKWYLLYPNCLILKIWVLILFFIFIYTSIIIPFNISFIHDSNNKFAYYNNIIINILFSIDMIINFLSPLTVKGKLLNDLKSIALNYLKTWFLIDFFSLLPLELIDLEFFKKFYYIFKLLRMLKLIKIIRIFKINNFLKKKLFKNINRYFNLNKNVSQLISFIFIIIIIVHFYSCLWHYIAYLNKYDEYTWVYNYYLKNFNIKIIDYQYILKKDRFIIYLYSLYWCLTTITTVGYGDIHSTLNSELELIFNFIWLIIGVAFFSYIVGTLSHIISASSDSKLASKFFFLNKFSKEKKLSFDLINKISKYIKFISNRSIINKNLINSNFLDNLTFELKYKIAESIYDNLVNKISFFKKLDKNFISEMIPLLKPINFLKYDIIYNKNDFPNYSIFNKFI